MASLNETSKQLKVAEERVRALTLELKKLENEYNATGDSSIVTNWQKTNNKLDEATTKLAKLKSEYKAIARNDIFSSLSKSETTIDTLNKQANKLGINVKTLNSRLDATNSYIKKAFYSGDIEKAISLLATYSNEIDRLNNKIAGQSKSKDIAIKIANDAAKEQAKIAKEQAKEQAKIAEEQAKDKAKSLDNKSKYRTDIFSNISKNEATIANLNSKAQLLGINVDSLNNKLNAISNTIKTAFYSGDIEKSKDLLVVYSNEIDKLKNKIEGQSKAQDIAVKNRNKEIEATKKLAEEQTKIAEEQAKAKAKSLNDKSIARTNIFDGIKKGESDINIINQQAQALGINVDKINSRLIAMSSAIKTAFYSGDIDRARSLMSVYGNEVDKLRNKVEGQSKAQNISKESQRQAAEETKRAAEKEKQAYEESVNAARQKVSGVLSVIKSFANGVNNTVNKIISIIRTGIRLVNSIIGGIVKTITTLGHGVKSIIGIFGNLGNRVRGGSNNFNIFSKSATELRSKILLLKSALSTLFNNSMVAGATKLMSSVMSLDVIIGDDLTKSTIEWANGMQDAFGVDARGLISDLQEVTGVLKGLGMNNQDISVMGPNLLSISRYLAMMGLAGGDAEMAMYKITSGLKGMTQSIDDLGLSVRESEMNDFLKKLKQQGGELANIGTKYANLNEEARIYVRSASILKQFLTNFGTFNSDLSEYVFNVAAFTRTLNSVTGRISILKQAWSGFLSTIGSGLMKVAAVVAGYIIPVLRKATAAVEDFFAWLSALTGINFNVKLGSDLNSLENLEDSSGGVKETTNGVSDLNDELEKVDENAKKAKGSLQSFDRVNNVTSSSGSSSSKSGTDAFDYAKVLGGFNKLLDPLDKEYEKFLDSLNEKNQKWFNQFKNWLIRKCKEITGRANFDLGFDWQAIKENLDTTWKNIKKLIKSWGTFFIEIGLKIADDINIGKIITKFSEFTSAVTDLAVAFSEVLIPVLRNFYDEVLSPIVKLVGEKIVNAFDKAIEKVKKWTKYLKDNKPELIEEWTEKLKHFFNVVAGKESANTEDGAIGTVLEILNKIGKVIKALIPIILELASALGVFLKEEFLPWLNEKLGELAEWLSENKDAIVKFLKDIAGFVWDSFKVFVDLIGKLVDFCVKHPTAVKTFLVGLVAIKIASWATSSAAGIGQLVFQLQLLSKLGGITKALGGIGTAATATSTELATIGAASGTAAKTSVLSKILGKTGSAVVGGLGTVGTALGSTATTSTGLAVAGGASIAGIAAGVAGIGSGIKDLYDASKETNDEIKEQKNWSGGTKIGMVGAGATTGAAIGSVVPGVGTAVGAAVGAGVSGVAAIFKGSDISEWLHDAWDNTLKPFFTESIPEAFGKLVDGIGQFFTETIPNTISNIGTGISTFFTETVPGFFSDLWEGVKTFFTETVPQTISNIASSISTFFTETVPGFFGNLIDGVVQFFTEDVPYALGYIAGSLKVFFTETVPGFFKGLWKDIKTFFTETIPTTLETITEKATTFLTETIPGFFKGLWKDIKALFTETIPTALETISTKATTFLTETIPNFFAGIWKKIKAFFTETIPNAVETIKTKAKTFLTETIPNFFAGIWKKIKAFFTETIPTAIETIKIKAKTFFTETIPNFFSGIWKKIKAFFTETIPTAISKVKTGIKTFFTETIPNKVKGLFGGIGDLFGGAVDWIKNKFSSIGSNFSAGFDAAVSSKSKATKAKSVTTHAVGGSIAGGQLFIANENGGAELVGNITGASGAQVANNGMIIEAMTSGVFEGVYNALAEINNQRVGNSMGGGNTTIKLDGFGLIDSSTLSELARMLAPYLSSNNKNIADVNFSI